MLKKEVMKTQSKDLEKGAEYRQLLVQAIHSWCAPGYRNLGARVQFGRQSVVQAIHSWSAPLGRVLHLDRGCLLRRPVNDLAYFHQVLVHTCPCGTCRVLPSR